MMSLFHGGFSGAQFPPTIFGCPFPTGWCPGKMAGRFPMGKTPRPSRFLVVGPLGVQKKHGNMDRNSMKQCAKALKIVEYRQILQINPSFDLPKIIRIIQEYTRKSSEDRYSTNMNNWHIKQYETRPNAIKDHILHPKIHWTDDPHPPFQLPHDRILTRRLAIHPKAIHFCRPPCGVLGELMEDSPVTHLEWNGRVLG